MQATPAANAPAASASVANAPAPFQHELYVHAVETGIALLGAFIVWWLAEAALNRVFAQKLLSRHPRVTTYLAPLKSLARFIILFVLALVLLEIWSVNVAPAVWSAGAITAVLAFGAQWVVRDLLAGYSIFAENQFDVGDRIEITTGLNSRVSGVVDTVGLRMTRLIDEGGRTVFVPNGNIYYVTNLSKGVERLELSLTVPWRGAVETMRKELLAIATDAAGELKTGTEGVSVVLHDFDLQGATFTIAMRAPRTYASADETVFRERIAAGLQAQGWLANPPAPNPPAPN